ncbi:LLM class flavin-dependent oxidoreductase, partial [Listeria monocytogenes]|nr:LLM class flavin-dependent oxidoreductase [Listeria monocytogenes]
MTRKETIQFGAIIHGVGGTTDGWRHPDINPAASTDLDFYKTRAKIAEQG